MSKGSLAVVVVSLSIIYRKDKMEKKQTNPSYNIDSDINNNNVIIITITIILELNLIIQVK